MNSKGKGKMAAQQGTLYINHQPSSIRTPNSATDKRKDKRAASSPPPEEPVAKRPQYATPTTGNSMHVLQQPSDVTQTSPQQRIFGIPFGQSLAQLRQTIHTAFHLDNQQLDIVRLFVLPTTGGLQELDDEAQWVQILNAFQAGTRDFDLNIEFSTTRGQPSMPSTPAVSENEDTPQPSVITTERKAVFKSGLPKNDKEFLRLYKIGEGQDGVNPLDEISISNNYDCTRTNVKHRLTASMDRELFKGAGKAWSVLRRAEYPGPTFNSQAAYDFVRANRRDANGQERDAAGIVAFMRQAVAALRQTPGSSSSRPRPAVAQRSQRVTRTQATPSDPGPSRVNAASDSAAPSERRMRDRKPSRLLLEARADEVAPEATEVENMCRDEGGQAGQEMSEAQKAKVDRIARRELENLRSATAAARQPLFGGALRRKLDRDQGHSANRDPSPASKQRRLRMLEQEIDAFRGSRNAKGQTKPHLIARASATAGKKHNDGLDKYLADTTSRGQLGPASAPVFPHPSSSMNRDEDDAMDVDVPTPSASQMVQEDFTPASNGRQSDAGRRLWDSVWQPAGSPMPRYPLDYRTVPPSAHNQSDAETPCTSNEPDQRMEEDEPEEAGEEEASEDQEDGPIDHEAYNKLMRRYPNFKPDDK